MADAAHQSCRTNQGDVALRPRISLRIVAVPRPLSRRRPSVTKGLVAISPSLVFPVPTLSTTSPTHQSLGERGTSPHPSSGHPKSNRKTTRPRLGLALMNNPGYAAPEADAPIAQTPSVKRGYGNRNWRWCSQWCYQTCRDLQRQGAICNVAFTIQRTIADARASAIVVAHDAAS